MRGLYVFEIRAGGVPLVVPAWSRTTLVFQYGDLYTFYDRVGQPVPTVRLGFTGIMTGALHIPPECRASIRMIGVDLLPLALYGLMGAGVHELQNRASDLQDVLGGFRAPEIPERIAEAADERERLTIVQDFVRGLFSRYGDRHSSHPLVREAVQRIHTASGNLSLRELSLELGCTERHLRREFQRGIGVAPKQYAGLVRVEQVIGTLYSEKNGGSNGSVKTGALAERFGYHDQSHLIRDMKKNVMLTPGELIATGQVDWLRYFFL